MQIRYDMVSCFVVRAKDKSHEFLQLRRQSNDFMGGTWQTIHGKIEPNETAVEAALRELREETGLVPTEFYQLDQVHIFYVAAQDTLWHCIQFCALINNEVVNLNDEHDSFRWIDASNAAGQFMWPGDRNAINEIQKQILSDGPAKKYMLIARPKI